MIYQNWKRKLNKFKSNGNQEYSLWITNILHLNKLKKKNKKEFQISLKYWPIIKIEF